ncbi:Ulp1 family isopeptidase [Candidatus Tisiphia endosymbiont of Thecophora atra]|uniref:Ulp1 family isopeptidase n=1 Tax=Candidatus Tisiphia endosymbiont of Thecophora atra TaxID=3066258 RepID=UPI00312C9F1B
MKEKSKKSISSFLVKAKEDVEFMRYYNAIQNNDSISELKESLKGIKSKSKDDLEKIKEKSKKLQIELEELKEKYKNNNNVQEFNELFKYGKGDLDFVSIESIKNISIITKGILDPNKSQSSPSDSLKHSDAVEIIKCLAKKGFKENLLSQEEISENDLNSIKQINKFYETLLPPQNHIFFKRNLEKIIDDESQLRQICGEKAKQISDDEWYNDNHMRIIGKKILAPYCDVGTYQYIERLTYSLIDNDFIKTINVGVQEVLSIPKDTIVFERKELLESKESDYNHKKELQSNNYSKIEANTNQPFIDSPKYISFNVNNNHWIAICILNYKGRVKFLFKDSLGNTHKYVAEKFKREFKEIGIDLADTDFIYSEIKDQKDSYNCGPMCLENLKIIARTLKENGKEHLVDNFQSIKFCTAEDAYFVRKNHNAIITQQVEQGKKVAQELFKKVQIQFEEVEKDLVIDEDFDSYKQEAEKILKELDKLIKLDRSNTEIKGYKSKVLYTIAHKSFELKNYKEAYHYAEELSIHGTHPNSEKLRDIIKKELPDSSVVEDQDRLIELKQLNKDEKLHKQLEVLITKLKIVKNEIPKYENFSKDDILKWKEADIKTKSIEECIAVVNRANYIDTFERGGNGHTLRDTQIISVLSFFDAEKNGRLEQIKTGEGKSTIVSVLAIIKALQGKKVDVLTSSGILAERDASEKESLYKLFGLSVSHNGMNLTYIRGSKECYEADILYGSISNFQFDLLKHEHQDLETRGKQGKERAFDVVIVDEADSMLVDNGGHLAKLSGSLPGMEYLEPFLVYIWYEVKKLSPNIMLLTQLIQKDLTQIKNYKTFKEQIVTKVKNLIDDGKLILPSIDDNGVKGEKEFDILLPVHLKKYLSFQVDNCFNKEVLSVPKGTIALESKNSPESKEDSEDKNKESEDESNLKEYTSSQVDKWVDNAFKAAFIYQVDREYTLEKNGEELIIAPVDASNTGTIQKGTIWSNGLQQFLQLKHGLRLTAESCNTSYISNIGFVKRYVKHFVDSQGEKAQEQPSIFGLTGTLGGDKERELLSKSYNGIDFLEIPTFKKKIFTKEPTILKKSEDEWLESITSDAISRTKERAVLIICETIEEAKLIYNRISLHQKLQDKQGDLKCYLKDDQSNVTEEKMEVGDILVATNLAGRGTDIKISPTLEANNGMHLCLTFLPPNERVEEQALGRTSRQGKPGTGQLILKENKFIKELKEYVDEWLRKNNKDCSEQHYIEMIEGCRNEIENQRVSEIIDLRLESINIADELFNKFSQLCKDLKKDNEGINWFYIVIKAIEERWGFWLKDLNLDDKKTFDKGDIEKINKKFEGFQANIRRYFTQKDDENGSLEVIENPFYLIDIGGYCINQREFTLAKKALQKAISLENNEMMIPGAYYLLAFTEVALGKTAESVLEKAVESIIPFLNLKDKNTRECVISEAKRNLDKAKEGIEKNKELYSLILNTVYLLPPDVQKQKDNENNFQEKVIDLLKPLLNAGIKDKKAIENNIDKYIEYFNIESEEDSKNIRNLYSPLLNFDYTKSKEIENKTIFINQLVVVIDSLIKYQENNDESIKVLEKEEQPKNSLLINHLNSKITALTTYILYIQGNKTSIEECAKKAAGYIAVKSIINLDLKTIDFGGNTDLNKIEDKEAKKEAEENVKKAKELEEQLKSIIKKPELLELSSIGLKYIFKVKEIGDIPLEKVIAADAQIAAGLALYTSAAAFPPAAPALCPIASTCVSEGISDIISNLIDLFADKCESFDKEARESYAKQKGISVGITLGTMGIGAIAKMPSVINGGITACQKVSKSLRSFTGTFGKICNKLADKVDEIIVKLTKTLEKVNEATQKTKSLFDGLSKQIIDKTIEKVDFESLGLEDVKKYISVAISLKKGLETGSLTAILESIPNTGIKELDDIVNVASKVNGFRNGIKSGSATKMLEALQDIGKMTGIPELDNIIDVAQKINGVRKAGESGSATKILEALQDIGKMTGILELDNIIDVAQKINGVRKAGESGSATKILEALQDIGKMIGIPELDNIIDVAQKINGVRKAGESGSATKMLEALQDIGKMTGIPELDNIIDVVQKINGVRKAGESGSATKILEALQDIGKMTGIPELDNIIDVAQKINEVRKAGESGSATKMLEALQDIGKMTDIPELDNIIDVAQKINGVRKAGESGSVTKMLEALQDIGKMTGILELDNIIDVAQKINGVRKAGESGSATKMLEALQDIGKMTGIPELDNIIDVAQKINGVRKAGESGSATKMLEALQDIGKMTGIPELDNIIDVVQKINGVRKAGESGSATKILEALQDIGKMTGIPELDNIIDVAQKINGVRKAGESGSATKMLEALQDIGKMTGIPELDNIIDVAQKINGVRKAGESGSATKMLEALQDIGKMTGIPELDNIIDVAQKINGVRKAGESGSATKMLEALQDIGKMTGIPELDNIIDVVQKINGVRKAGESGSATKILEALQDIGKMTGIPELDNIIDVAQKINGVRKAGESGSATKMLEALQDIGKMTGIPELDNIIDVVQKINGVRKAGESGSATKILEALQDIGKMTGIPELDNIIDVAQKINGVRKAGESGSATKILEALQDIGKMTGIPELDNIIDVAQKINGVRKAGESGSATKMLEALQDIGKMTGIPELDNIIDVAQKIKQIHNNLQEGLAAGSLTQLLQAVPNTSIAELDQFVTTVKQVNDIRNNLQKGLAANSLTQLLQAVPNTGITELDQFVSIARKIDSVFNNLEGSIENGNLQEVLKNILKTELYNIVTKQIYLTIQKSSEKYHKAYNNIVENLSVNENNEQKILLGECEDQFESTL